MCLKFSPHTLPVQQFLIIGLHCKYQLLRYKPWTTNQNNAWDNEQSPTHNLYINCWKQFLQTPFAQNNVPDWHNKLSDIEHLNDLTGDNDAHETDDQDYQHNSQEKWMLISNLHALEANAPSEVDVSHNWQEDTSSNTMQQIQQMPSWKSSQKECYIHQLDFTRFEIDPATFSKVQAKAYSIVRSHLELADRPKRAVAFDNHWL